jgi:type II secretory pathway pseudopilin PulG
MAQGSAWPAIRPNPPRVDLLPREVHEGRMLRRQRAGLGAALLVLLALLGLLYVLGTNQLRAARRDADRAEAVAVGLRAQKVALQPYADLQTQVDAASQLRTRVYAKEVRVSQVMRDVAAIVPDTVWLTQMNVAFSGVTGTAAGGTATPPATTGTSGGSATMATPGSPGAGSPVATITFTGSALGLVEVGQFMRALAAGPTKGGQRVYTNPYFTSSQKTSGTTTVTFSATVDLSSAAYSSRFQRSG